MRKHHPENERIKRRYVRFMRDAKGHSEATIDQAIAAIAAFEATTNYKDFKHFHIEQATRFKRGLDEQINLKTGKPLAKATIYSRLMALKAFVHWLADQSGYKSRIRYTDAAYFSPLANDSRIAKAVRETAVPTLEQIRHVLFKMAVETDTQRRDRALVAFTILSGARDNAIASLSIKHVDIKRRMVFQDAREVRTKRAKTIQSYFFPIGNDVEAIVIDWIKYLLSERLFSGDDPLFPATLIMQNVNHQFAAAGLSRNHWRNASAIRRIFREAFEAAGLPYFNPHTFRKTLARLGEMLCQTPEEFKAWSQNLGHDHVLTTLTSYGGVAQRRQAEILDGFRGKDDGPGEAALAKDAIELLMEALRREAVLIPQVPER